VEQQELLIQVAVVEEQVVVLQLMLVLVVQV
jgi:hypothetical protein